MSITDQAINQSVLHQTTQLLEHTTDAYIFLDTYWCVTHVNPAASHLLGRSPHDVIGHNLWHLCPDLVGSTLHQEAHHAVTQHIALLFESFYPCFNGWFEVRIFPARTGVTLMFRETTEHRLAEAELLEMSTALGNAGEGIARINLQGQFVALNRAYASALGYQQEEVLGLNWQDMVHREDVGALMASYQQMILHGKAEVEVRTRHKNGAFTYQEVVMVTAHDWDDRLVGHHCFTKNISERKQAEHALRQQAEREQLMGAIARRIRQSLDLDAILNTAVSEVRQFLKVDRVVFYEFQAGREGVVIAESVGDKIPSTLGYRLDAPWFHQLQQDYQRGKNLVICDRETLPHEEGLQQFMRDRQIYAILSVPIVHESRLWGILVAHQCQMPRTWDTVEVTLLEQLATQLAIAIQQSELYHQVQVLNAELEEQVRERTAQLQQSLDLEERLKRITDAVRDSFDEETILQTAVKELALGLDVDACDAALHQPDHTAIICYEFIRSDLPPAKGSVIQMSDFPEIYSQLQQAQCFQFSRIGSGTVRPVTHNHAILACPLVDDQGVIGDLWLLRSGTQAFNILEIRLVQQVANQCAIAIRQARLYQAAQAQVAALEELNLCKDDFLSTVSHELRTPMANMKMAIHMLRNAATPERQQRYFDILQKECTREIDLINDLLDLQRLEANSYDVSLVPLCLSEFLPPLIAPFYSRSSDRHQTLTVDLPDTLPTIITDKASLERILAELLNNACKYTSPNGEIRLTVQAHAHPCSTPNQFFLQVSNHGEIPATELTRVFNKFYRIPNGDRWKQGGTGLGLALVQRLVQQLGGQIHVTSEAGWTIFTLSL